MDDPQSSTPLGDDTINKEIEDSTQSERDPQDGVILAQPAMEKPVTPLIPSTEASQDAENPSTQDA